MNKVEIYKASKQGKYMFHIIFFDHENSLHVIEPLVEKVISRYNELIEENVDPFYAYSKIFNEFEDKGVTMNDQCIDSPYYNRFEIKKVFVDI